MTSPAITGVGMTSFGKHLDKSLKDLGREAIDNALADASIAIEDVDMVFAANAMASIVTGQVSVVGQTILREMGFEKIPVFNIDNACAGSSSALALAAQAIAAGAASRVLVFGVEKLYAEDRSLAYRALNGAADIDLVNASGINIGAESVFVAAVYPERLHSYKARYGLDPETLAKISVKNRLHAGHNPDAQYVKPITVEEVLDSRMVADPLTALMCAPIGDGASAVILSRADQVMDESRAVWLRSCVIGMGSAAGEISSIRRVADEAYRLAGVTADDVDVAEVHDSVAFNELVAYEELGFCPVGEGADLVTDRSTTLGGRLPVNPSGGLESRGHPVAATGLAQIIELVGQIRGEAGKRQVSGATIGIAENAGGFAGNDTAAIAVTIVAAGPVA